MSLVQEDDLKYKRLMKKINDQKLELTIINKRLSESNRKMKIIEECDRIKYELAPLSYNCGFRQTISNPWNKKKIEAIFNTNQSECIRIYNDLLQKRNILAHKYTRKAWTPGIIRTHGRPVKDLLKSISVKDLIA